MNVQAFEQAILKMAFETDARITTASVAYYLRIPSRRANELLNELLKEGVLELDSDVEGNLYYRVPSRAALGADVIRMAARSGDGEAAGGAVGATQVQGFAGVNLVGPEEGEETEPWSPRSSPEAFDARFGAESGRRADAPEADGSPGTSPRPGDFRRVGHRPRSPAAARMAKAPKQGRRSAVAVAEDQRDGSLFGPMTLRQGAPDAALDSCGANQLIVGDAARCQPSPLPSRKAEVATCVDEEARGSAGEERRRRREDFFAQERTGGGMLAPVGGGQLTALDESLDRPEHQPGMALLLSLILCGTGQIYNGEVSKGIMMMVLCFLLWFVLLGWVVHIWSIVDSVVIAERLNRSSE